MTRLLILAIAAVAGTGAQMRRADERPFIAFRYDADRVVIYTAEDPRLPPPEPGQRRRLPPGLMPLASPRAAWPGPHIAELQRRTTRSIVPALAGPSTRLRAWP